MMTGAEFAPVARLSEVPPGQLLSICAPNGEQVVLTNADGEIGALLDCCSHHEFALSAGEILDDGTIECVFHGARFDSPNLSLSLYSSVPLREAERASADAEFALEQGQSALFVLGGCDQNSLPAPSESSADEIFNETVKYWRDWLSACTYRGRWREQVERSALALKLLTFQPTGAIVAAPTCSLPEFIGGGRN